MAVDWDGLSPRLLLPLDRSVPEPLRAQLERGLREAVRDGRLLPGERLPSSREMARELGVSRGLVQECYAQLYAEGYLTARAGSATRVAVTTGGLRKPAPVLAGTESPPLIDFAAGVPDLGSFPRRDWAWATREAITQLPALGYPDPRGDGGFREVLARYLRRVRGSAAEPGLIVGCTGSAQGLGLVLRALAEAGIRQVAVEDPGHAPALATASWAGVDPVPVPVDADGLDVRTLAATGVRAVLVSPAHQWPTGAVLGPGRRRELAAWAEACDGVIIEDDYAAEFRYDREPIGTLQGLAPGRVFCLGTVSASLAPALRLGWVLCPPAYAEAVVRQKRLGDRGSPPVDQLALARLIASGRHDRHLRRMRGLYAARRRALADVLATYAPHVTLDGPAAGFHAVARLRDAADEDAIARAAAERSVGVTALGTYRFIETPAPPALVLGFGNLPERSIRDGITTIADLL